MFRVTIAIAILLTVHLLLISSWSIAQESCATPQLSDDQLTRQENLLAQRTRALSARRAAQVQYMPIRFHVVRRSDGTGGASVASLNQALVLLNQLYQPVGMAFYLCGAQPHYIDNTALFDYDNSEESLLANANDVSYAINVYLTNTLSYGGNQATGYAYFPSSLAISNRVFVKASQVTEYTLSHELGHYFNLYHTFQSNQSSTVANRELVIRPDESQQGRPFAPNCDTAGDFVCDTPADPYNRPGATVSGCTYSGTTTDANGDLFKPLVSNIMSYYFSCANGYTFTPGQYARITDGISLRLNPGNEYALLCANNPVSAPTNLVASIQSGGAQIQFAYAGSDAAGFLIERSLEPTTNFTVIGSLSPGLFSFVDGNLTANTTYYYRVKASNASSQYSQVVSLNSGLFYCIPVYTWPVSNFKPKIDDFILTGSQSTLRSVATGAGPAGYSDFTATQLNAQPSHVYSFTASAVTGNTGSYIKQHLSIWLDSNRDGIFSDTERLFQSSPTQYLAPSLVSTITIPASASAGPTKLRLRSQYASDGLVVSPCDPYNYGETEDYTIVIDGPNPNPATCFSLVAAATPVHCVGNQDGAVSLTAVGGTAPFSYSLNNQSNATGTFTNLSAGSYTAIVTNAACSQSLVVTVGQPTEVTASISPSSASTCSGQSLTVVASQGSQYLWNTGQTSSSLIVAASGTYSVTITSDIGCTSKASTSVLIVNCPQSIVVRAKLLLEGFTDAQTGLMHTLLVSSNLIPKQQPYSSMPWSYTGSEQVSSFPANVTDWVLVVARNAAGSVLARKAAFVRNDGVLINTDGTEGVIFSSVSEPIYASIHHRSHLAILSNQPIANNQLVDFTTDATAARGTSQLVLIGAKLAMYSGDYDANDVINSTDYNRWKVNASAVGRYLSIDADGNGVVNNQDFNRWVLNRSKIGTPGL
ncbi:hypothetical protein EXU85_27510 [Spirosoma sp. KCTC 42546]|nr:hypothetical protein EXU85_27510 [Spirosoma sp. KCTC 42546]